MQISINTYTHAQTYMHAHMCIYMQNVWTEVDIFTHTHTFIYIYIYLQYMYIYTIYTHHVPCNLFYVTSLCLADGSLACRCGRPRTRPPASTDVVTAVAGKTSELSALGRREQSGLGPSRSLSIRHMHALAYMYMSVDVDVCLFVCLFVRSFVYLCAYAHHTCTCQRMRVCICIGL